MPGRRRGSPAGQPRYRWSRWGSLRGRGHEDEERQSRRARVRHAMLGAGGAEDRISLSESFLTLVDAKVTDPLQHVVDLVGPRVPMARLRLPGLERIDVAEESLAREDAVLLHLLGAELDRSRELPEDFHRVKISARFR